MMLRLSVLAVGVLAACSRAGAPASPSPTAASRAPLTLTYLGVAGWTIDDGTHVVLVDPYFSRPPRDAPADAPLVPDATAIAAHAPPRADLILVSHSHFDHALDVAEVAKRTGAEVVGTVSTARLALAGGVPADHVVPVKGGEDYQFDGVSVRVLPSLHAALDDKHTFGGADEIPEDVRLPLPAGGYREGGTLAFLVRMGGHQVLVLGTANFIEREVEGLRPDVVIVAVGRRQEITDYSCRLVAALGAPPLVLLNHFDNHEVPARGVFAGLGATSSAAVQAVPAELRACAPSMRVVVPEHFAPIRWP